MWTWRLLAVRKIFGDKKKKKQSSRTGHVCTRTIAFWYQSAARDEVDLDSDTSSPLTRLVVYFPGCPLQNRRLPFTTPRARKREFFCWDNIIFSLLFALARRLYDGSASPWEWDAERSGHWTCQPFCVSHFLPFCGRPSRAPASREVPLQRVTPFIPNFFFFFFCVFFLLSAGFVGATIKIIECVVLQPCFGTWITRSVSYRSPPRQPVGEVRLVRSPRSILDGSNSPFDVLYITGLFFFFSKGKKEKAWRHSSRGARALPRVRMHH